MADIQRTTWFIVINSPENETIYDVDKRLLEYLLMDVDKYYHIIHDKDVFETGELKTPHLHLLVELRTRQRKMTILNRISKYAEIPQFCISVDECRNISKSAQYLLHMNDKNKFQYDKTLIETNDEERLKYLLTSNERTAITTDELFDIVDNAKTIRELIRKIGIDLYCKYARVIEILWKDKQQRYYAVDED